MLPVMTKDQIVEILTEIATLARTQRREPVQIARLRTMRRARPAKFHRPPGENLFPGFHRAHQGYRRQASMKKSPNWLTTGSLAYYDELKASIPPGLVAMLSHSRPGPKKNQGDQRQAWRGYLGTIGASLPGRESRPVGRVRRENPGQHFAGHRVPAAIRLPPFARRRPRRGGADSGQSAQPPRRGALQHRGQPAPVQGDHRRHRFAGFIKAARRGHRFFHRATRHPQRYRPKARPRPA